MSDSASDSPHGNGHSPKLSLEASMKKRRYRNCYYHNGKFCCSKICAIVVLLIFITVCSVIVTVLAVVMDNWAGISTNPYATLDLPYPRLGPNYMDYIMFNKTIPNDDGTLYKYIDEAASPVRLITSRFGLLSHCKSPIDGPRIALFKTPWKAPVCRPSSDEFQCPIIAMRLQPGAEPMSPMTATTLSQINGCIKNTKKCDGSIDCPSGHDELNCPQPAPSCPHNMVQCAPDKPICILKASVCNGINDCGMNEDEKSCCSRSGFISCADGSCVMGERCDAKADCMDLSDEYDCPRPSSGFYTQCRNGQLIESYYRCDMKEYPSFQCQDLSDETNCDFNPQPQTMNPAIMTSEYDTKESCFKQAFTFLPLNESLLELNYPDKRQRQFVKTYEYSNTKLAIIISIFVTLCINLGALGILLCFGRLTKRCRPMRCTFIVLALLYLICNIQMLLTGAFWVKYTSALNDVLENPSGSDILEEISIENIQVTGGLASIRISTQLAFYTCGFFAFAMILCITAAQLLKNASCHTNTLDDFTKYHGSVYSDDLLNADDMLLPGSPKKLDFVPQSHDVPTPDQIVTPHRSMSSMQGIIRSASGSLGRLNGLALNGNTYISYKDTLDSIDRADRVSHISARTMDSRIRHTQV